jgi:hypothetical protein
MQTKYKTSIPTAQETKSESAATLSVFVVVLIQNTQTQYMLPLAEYMVTSGPNTQNIFSPLRN